MKCPKCRTDNFDMRKYCRECGERLSSVCPECGIENLSQDKYCGECGYRLEGGAEKERKVSALESERKPVTVLFSDVSGYTTITERLDPEEVKDIMSRIFGEIAQVVAKYEGFIERFVGDAVMALFGVPRAHEDDAVRAIKAANEIHARVEAISPKLERKIGQALWMHSGINTGLVVTGEVNLEKGTHGITGDTVNLASRLQGLARAGEILVGLNTYRQAEGYFIFETLEPTPIKGKAEPVQAYKVLSPKERPVKIHRLSGLRSDLIGRKGEMAQLAEAVERLRKGQGATICIFGDSGTGKSRLVEEFKARLELKEIQWEEGHAYPYSQNIPYASLIHLLSRAFRIEDDDPQEKVKAKIESGIKFLVAEKEEIIPYIASLYALKYPGIDGVSPEVWKSRLHDAILKILSSLAKRAPTIICLEDLHWADPSSLDLLWFILSEFRQPALFLCVYRPPFSFFPRRQLKSIGRTYQEIELQDLSTAETEDMVRSMLKTRTIPPDLGKFIREKVEGNPFYLEEMVNSLIESGTLISENGAWKLTRKIDESEIPPTVQGLISARLDRLERDTKRILQEASVIGRSFLYELLKSTTELKDKINECLNGLERLDLIRARSPQQELEYTFKHALTHEVVYNGLLKKERREIHERIALVMEEIFQDRLPEYYETLAYHFKSGRSAQKAANYLVKSGEKSLSRYSVEESHQYFKEAFDILSKKAKKTSEDEEEIIDLLNKWGFVFYYRGDYKTLPALLTEHRQLAESLQDKSKLGIFYCWLGAALLHIENVGEAYKYLKKALFLGEEIDNHKVIGHACSWLTWTCAELGLLDEAVLCGRRSEGMSKSLESEDFYCLTLAGLGQGYWYQGETKKTFEVGERLLEHSQKISNVRGMVLGHYIIGCSHFMSGDFSSAIDRYERAIRLSADPYYSQWPKMLLCLVYALNGQYVEAEETLEDLLDYTRNFGVEIIGTPASSIKGIVLIGRGNLREGIKIYEKGRQSYMMKERRWCYALSEYILGTIYLEVMRGKGLKRISIMARNFGFIVKNLPFLSKKAEHHLNKSIEIAKEIGSKITLGMAYLNLGRLHRSKGRIEKARECISQAIEVFDQSQADVYLKQAKEALASLTRVSGSSQRLS